MNEKHPQNTQLIFELDYELLNFKLLRSENGQEVLSVNGEELESERSLQSRSEYQLGHPELGNLVIRYQIFPGQNICKYFLLRNDELLHDGEQNLPEDIVDAEEEQPEQNRGHTIDLIVLALKLFKGAKAVKVLLAGSALAGWSIMFSWQFALILIAVICFHEYGHLWAMKRTGLTTKGMYLIPFVGGVAAGDKARTHWQQVFIAMMGPCFGLLMSVVFYLAYLITENHFIGLVASISVLINIFNLLPVLPLDGGQVVKAMVFSGRSYLPYLGLMIISAGMFALSLQLGLALLGFFVIIGAVDLVFSWKEFKHQTVTPMDRYGVVFSLVWYLLTVGAFIFIILSIADSGLPGSEIATTVLNS